MKSKSSAKNFQPQVWKTKILDGKALSQKLLTDLSKKNQASKFKLTLAVVVVGNNKVSRLYLKKKRQACQDLGIRFKLYSFPKNISYYKLKKEVAKIVKLKSSSGIIIQLPLPFSFIATSQLLSMIPTSKDVDCLNQHNQLVLAPVVSAIAKLFQQYRIGLEKKQVLIVGAGRLVGKPVNAWLLSKGLKTVVADKSTKSIAKLAKRADIIISGVGQSHLIKGSMIKKGAIVVDVGASTEKCKVLGDVDTKSVLPKVKFLAPVPGGVGPLTIACLLENLFILNRKTAS